MAAHSTGALSARGRHRDRSPCPLGVLAAPEPQIAL
jgi:hypothetical protein